VNGHLLFSEFAIRIFPNFDCAGQWQELGVGSMVIRGGRAPSLWLGG
jgi:hypothetical protein